MFHATCTIDDQSRLISHGCVNSQVEFTSRLKREVGSLLYSSLNHFAFHFKICYPKNQLAKEKDGKGILTPLGLVDAVSRSLSPTEGDFTGLVDIEVQDVLYNFPARASMNRASCVDILPVVSRRP